GNGKSAKAYIDTIGTTNGGTLVFRHNSGGATTTYQFSTDETIPSNIKVVIEKGAILSIADTKTLTINGPFSAGIYQVFSGDGSVSFGTGAISEVWINWWGADINESRANNTIYIQKAINAVTKNTGDATVSAVLRIPVGTFNVNNGTLTVPGNYSSGFHLKGSGWRNASVINGAGVGDTLFLEDAQYNVQISDLRITGDSDTTACISSQAQNVQFRNLYLSGAKIGLKIPDNTSRAAIFVDFCHITGNTEYGIYLASGGGIAGGVHIKNSWISSNGSLETHYQVYIHGGYVISFIDNVVERTGSAKGVGLALGGSAAAIRVVGNECEGVGFEIGNAGNTINGVFIATNYVSGDVEGTAAFVINRADNMIAFGNDFTGLTAGKYGYSVNTSVTYAMLGPDRCATNYYTGTIGSNSIIFGTSSASDANSWTGDININGSFEANTRLAMAGNAGAGNRGGNVHILDAGSLEPASGGSTDSFDLDMKTTSNGAYVEVIITGRFDNYTRYISKHIGVSFYLYNNSLNDQTVSEIKSIGDALNSDLALSISAVGSDNKVRFTLTNNNASYGFQGSATVRVYLYSANTAAPEIS
ncbi:MAG: hypothetical protein J7L19_05810, partial [Dehalococcoidia bacterium]|nr:hypothetical protein [Dehalococcoidia bacterium]